MRLLVLGASSQLGCELGALLQQRGVDHEVVGSSGTELLKKQNVIRLLGRYKPDQVINVASYSNLSKAESDPEAAEQCDLINTQGVSTLAEVCEKLDIPLIHHSSSYVFDGQKLRPYEEEEQTNPVCRYGLSKWYGERAVRDILKHHVILRTDWMFSIHRNRFFRLHIEACKHNAGKTEVMRHRFSPTPAADVARVMLAIAQQVNCQADAWGTYHYSALQPMSEEHFVETLLREAVRYDPALAKLEAQFEIAVKEVEPPYIPNTTLNCQKIMETFGIKQRSRAAEVTRVLKALYGIEDPAPVPPPETPARKSEERRQKPPRKKKKPPRKRGDGPARKVADKGK